MPPSQLVASRAARTKQQRAWDFGLDRPSLRPCSSLSLSLSLSWRSRSHGPSFSISRRRRPSRRCAPRGIRRWLVKPPAPAAVGAGVTKGDLLAIQGAQFPARGALCIQFRQRGRHAVLAAACDDATGTRGFDRAIVRVDWCNRRLRLRSHCAGTHGYFDATATISTGADGQAGASPAIVASGRQRRSPARSDRGLWIWTGLHGRARLISRLSRLCTNQVAVPAPLCRFRHFAAAVVELRWRASARDGARASSPLLHQSVYAAAVVSRRCSLFPSYLSGAGSARRGLSPPFALIRHGVVDALFVFLARICSARGFAATRRR